MLATEIQSIPASSPAFHPLALVYVFPTWAQSGDARELNLHIQKSMHMIRIVNRNSIVYAILGAYR